MLSVVHLPDASVVTTVLCKLSTQACLTTTKIEDTHASIRVGVFANDASYWQYYLAFEGINVSLSFSGGNGPLTGLVEPLGCGDQGVNCSDYAVVTTTRFAWYRRGTVTADAAAGTLTLSPMGLQTHTVALTASGDPTITLPDPVTSGATYVAVRLTSAVGFVEGASLSEPYPETSGMPSVASIEKTIATARAKEYATYTKFDQYADVAEAIQAAVMWNYIYSPAELGPLLPVSRAWDFVKQAATDDWGYVVFDWDNYVC